jgi:hypothetical protein
MMENRGEGTRPNPKIKIKIRAPAIRSDRAVPEIVPRACLGGTYQVEASSEAQEYGWERDYRNRSF